MGDHVFRKRDPVPKIGTLFPEEGDPIARNREPVFFNVFSNQVRETGSPIRETGPLSLISLNCSLRESGNAPIFIAFWETVSPYWETGSHILEIGYPFFSSIAGPLFKETRSHVLENPPSGKQGSPFGKQNLIR